ncbi:uncharacterized protein FPRO_00318 [Fusarium proliferatum ET1]|uniref:Uncharacterized protein n=1 Tax=Fusarium proliferatum (strain ET1) TaxID=1227346 RepID=A0A1L7V3T8_FUSPR|nr:uncharacterized protein FPRO_00318 [Fusarium proliferatum ET1]CZR35559.1 uncharacterized protein FPRO_00318 [Fusarium proliferatum ET1]
MALMPGLTALLPSTPSPSTRLLSPPTTMFDDNELDESSLREALCQGELPFFLRDGVRGLVHPAPNTLHAPITLEDTLMTGTMLWHSFQIIVITYYGSSSLTLVMSLVYIVLQARNSMHSMPWTDDQETLQDDRLSSTQTIGGSAEDVGKWQAATDSALMSQGGHNTGPHTDSHGMGKWMTPSTVWPQRGDDQMAPGTRQALFRPQQQQSTVGLGSAKSRQHSHQPNPVLGTATDQAHPPCLSLAGLHYCLGHFIVHYLDLSCRRDAYVSSEGHWSVQGYATYCMDRRPPQSQVSSTYHMRNHNMALTSVALMKLYTEGHESQSRFRPPLLTPRSSSVSTTSSQAQGVHALLTRMSLKFHDGEPSSTSVTVQLTGKPMFQTRMSLQARALKKSDFQRMSLRALCLTVRELLLRDTKTQAQSFQARHRLMQQKSIKYSDFMQNITSGQVYNGDNNQHEYEIGLWYFSTGMASQGCP